MSESWRARETRLQGLEAEALDFGEGAGGSDFRVKVQKLSLPL